MFSSSVYIFRMNISSTWLVLPGKSHVFQTVLSSFVISVVTLTNCLYLYV